MVACLAVAALVLVVCGVRPFELLRLAAYEVVFVAGPGAAVVHAACRRTSALTLVALGWPVGYALSLAAFALGAISGARWLLYVYPVAVILLALVVATRRRDAESASRDSGAGRWPQWTTAAVVIAALGLLGFGYFASYPLPRAVDSVVLYPDNVFNIALAAEAGERWPMQDPNVAAEPLRYHVFVFMHAAAVSQTTGVELDVILLRYLPAILLMLTALQVFWLAGRASRGSPWIAPGAVAIVLLAGEMDVDPNRANPFVGFFFVDLPLSPTFAFGLSFFIAATGLLLAVLADRIRPTLGTWFVLGVLLAGAMGAKASTLPVLLAALGLFLATRLVLDRTLDRRAVQVFGLALSTFVVVYVALYSGGGDAGAAIRLFDFVEDGLFGKTVVGAGSILWGIAATLGLLAPWLGGLLLLRRVEGRDRLAALWLAAVALGALLPFLVLSQPGLSQIYFLHYGVPTAAVLSAWGIARVAPALASRRRLAAAAAAGTIAALVVATVLYSRVPVAEMPRERLYVALYGALLLAFVCIAFVAGRGLRAVLPLGVALVVAATLLDGPLDVVPDWVNDVRADQPHHAPDDPAGQRGINAELLAGLRWLRDNSDPDAVLAVDTQTVSKLGGAHYFYYAAYAERRTFLGGWAYTAEAVAHEAKARPGLPFRERRRLNDAAYAGDRRALNVLRRDHGVHYVLVDLRHSGPAPRLERLLPRVYANDVLRIYRLTGG